MELTAAFGFCPAVTHGLPTRTFPTFQEFSVFAFHRTYLPLEVCHHHVLSVLNSQCQVPNQACGKVTVFSCSSGDKIVFKSQIWPQMILYQPLTFELENSKLLLRIYNGLHALGGWGQQWQWGLIITRRKDSSDACITGAEMRRQKNWRGFGKKTSTIYLSRFRVSSVAVDRGPLPTWRIHANASA